MSINLDRARLRAGLLALVGWAYLAFAYRLPFRAPDSTVAIWLMCPFRRLTDLNCPLCGLTRSWHAVLTGRWFDGFAYHAVGPELLALWIALSGILTWSFFFADSRRALAFTGRLETFRQPVRER